MEEIIDYLHITIANKKAFSVLKTEISVVLTFAYFRRLGVCPPCRRFIEHSYRYPPFCCPFDNVFGGSHIIVL
jgi:hypothetical protein